MSRYGRKGFTLIEFLIIIVVIAILALILIPRLLAAGRKAREANLRGNLHQLRSAIQQFEADCGDYPAKLDELMTQPAEGTNGGTDIALDVKKWQGPYLGTPDGLLPDDPFTMRADWKYDPKTGAVHSSGTWTALDRTTKYNSW